MSGDPETHLSHTPVAMDGSCNGLQHYAALGLDLEGGAAVNLVNADQPQVRYVPSPPPQWSSAKNRQLECCKFS